jgi:hypothetical protein
VDVTRRAQVVLGALVPLLVAGALVVGGCTPSARTAGPFRAKAVTTAEAVHAAVGSDLLLLRAFRAGGHTAAFVSVATSDAEDAASSAASTFLSIQPPDGASRRLRGDLSDLLDRAQSVLGDARIAGRRGDGEALLGLQHRLADIDHDLQAFAEAQA